MSCAFVSSISPLRVDHPPIEVSEEIRPPHGSRIEQTCLFLLADPFNFLGFLGRCTCEASIINVRKMLEHILLLICVIPRALTKGSRQDATHSARTISTHATKHELIRYSISEFVYTWAVWRYKQVTLSRIRKRKPFGPLSHRSTPCRSLMHYVDLVGREKRRQRRLL